MAENKFPCTGGGVSREAVGIEAGRILDACRDRDCFEDIRVYLTPAGEELIARTGSVRVKSARICGANIVTEPVQFNCGFYAVDVKFYVGCSFEVCVPLGNAQEFEGVAVLEKRVVLYGGESNVNVFRSVAGGSYCAIPDLVCCAEKDPEAVVEVLDPVVLGAHILDNPSDCHCCCCCCDIPEQVTARFGNRLVDGEYAEGRYLAISLGIFSVVRLVREGQFLVQASEYCLPEKECVSPVENDPCATFRQIPFPAAEFCAVAASAPTTTIGTHRCCRNN